MRSGTKSFLSLLAVFAAVWFALRFLMPLFSPFLFGTLLALAAEPMVRFLCRRAHVPRGVGAGIGVSMAFAFAAMALLLLCAFLVKELGLLAGVLPDLGSTIRTGIALLQNWLLALTDHTPQSVQPLLRQQVSALFSGGADFVDRAVRYLLGLAGSLLSHVPDSALSLGTGIISAYLISAKLPGIKKWLLRRLPRERLRWLLTTLKGLKKAVAGWLMAEFKLMGVTFAILAVGFLVLRIPYALLWAVGTSLVDAFPILGTGTVLLPWSLVSLLQGDTARAVGLLGVYVVVSLTRSALEPKLVGRHMGLDPLVTLIALYAGYQLWGIGGMILAPLLAVTAAQLAGNAAKQPPPT